MVFPGFCATVRRRHEPQPQAARHARSRAHAPHGVGRGAGRTVRRHAADGAARHAAPGRGRPAQPVPWWRRRERLDGREHRLPGAQAAEPGRQARDRPQGGAGGSRGLLADPQHRHHDGGDCARTDAPQGLARDHEQPQCRGHSRGQPRLRTDRCRWHRARTRSRHRRRRDGGLHVAVQGRHRHHRHLGDRVRRHAARLRLPRGEGVAHDHRARAPGLAGRGSQQVRTGPRWSNWGDCSKSIACSRTSCRRRPSRACSATQARSW